jgi:hypothetical protein
MIFENLDKTTSVNRYLNRLNTLICIEGVSHIQVLTDVFLHSSADGESTFQITKAIIPLGLKYQSTTFTSTDMSNKINHLGSDFPLKLRKMTYWVYRKLYIISLT